MPSPQEPPSIFAGILGRPVKAGSLALLGPSPVRYEDLIVASEELEARLRTLGVAAGESVAVCADAGLVFVASLLACYRLGTIAVPIHPGLKALELDYLLRDSGACALIDGSGAGLLQERTEFRSLPWRDARILTGFERRVRPATTPGDLLLIYTSGSSGRPKGVLLTDRGISANVRAVCDYMNFDDNARSLLFTPPSYAYGLSHLLTHLHAGGALLPYTKGLRYPIEILRALSEHRLNGLAGTPSAHRLLLRTARMEARIVPGLRYVMSAGQGLDGGLARELSSTFAGAAILNMYGCTENSPRATYHKLPQDPPPRDTPWPAGRPVSGTSLRIVASSGAEAAVGQPGEVQIRGTSLMREYWGLPELTRERMAGGWFATRDLGFIDRDGLLNLCGRMDEIINVGSQKVAPEEIEEILRSVDGIQEAGVTAAEDEFLGQRPLALVVAATEEALQKAWAECRRKLSSFKVPSRIVRVPALPRTSNGKVDRKRLKEAASAFLRESPPPPSP